MSGFTDLFAPFTDNVYCLWFYYLSVIFFFFACLVVVYFLYTLVASKDKSAGHLFALAWVIFTYFIFYFINRLLYSMCVSSGFGKASSVAATVPSGGAPSSMMSMPAHF